MFFTAETCSFQLYQDNYANGAQKHQEKHPRTVLLEGMEHIEHGQVITIHMREAIARFVGSLFGLRRAHKDLRHVQHGHNRQDLVAALVVRTCLQTHKPKNNAKTQGQCLVDMTLCLEWM